MSIGLVLLHPLGRLSVSQSVCVFHIISSSIYNNVVSYCCCGRYSIISHSRTLFGSILPCMLSSSLFSLRCSLHPPMNQFLVSIIRCLIGEKAKWFMIYDRAKHVKLITLRLLPQNDSTMLEILSSPIQHTTPYILMMMMWLQSSCESTKLFQNQEATSPTLMWSKLKISQHFLHPYRHIQLSCCRSK